MAMMPDRSRHRKAPPLDGDALQRLALAYVGRYAVTRARLKTYLERKLGERGWEGEGRPPVDALVERFADLGYVDDRAFAAAKAESLGRRGYGARRVADALRQAGITPEDGAEAREQAAESAFAAALRFAQRRRIGPYAAEIPDRPGREKWMGAMLRAGHPLELARRIVSAPPGEVPDGEE